MFGRFWSGIVLVPLSESTSGAAKSFLIQHVFYCEELRLEPICAFDRLALFLELGVWSSVAHEWLSYCSLNCVATYKYHACLPYHTLLDFRLHIAQITVTVPLAVFTLYPPCLAHLSWPLGQNLVGILPRALKFRESIQKNVWWPSCISWTGKYVLRTVMYRLTVFVLRLVLDWMDMTVDLPDTSTVRILHTVSAWIILFLPRGVILT